MKNIILLLFLFSSLVSCALMPSKRNILVEPYLKEFEYQTGCKVLIPIEFGHFLIDKKKGTKVVGMCYGFKMPMIFRKIVLDTEDWNGSTSDEREAVLIHELGHCIGSLDHDDRLHENNFAYTRPKSIMYSKTFYQYSLYKKEYKREFYNRKWNCD